MTTATTFSCQNDTGSCASTTYYWENLVLVSGLVLESKDLYYLCYKNLNCTGQINFSEICPKNCDKIFCEIGRFFFASLPLKILQNLTFFRNLLDALIICKRAPVLNSSSTKRSINYMFFTVFFFTVDLNLPSWMGFELIQHCMITVLKHHVDLVFSSKYLQ